MMAQLGQAAVESGEWHGEYIDAAGHRGTLLLKLDTSAEHVSGSYELVVRAEDRPQVIRGDLRGIHSADGLEMQLQLGESKEQMKYSAQVSTARTHAEQAMFGLVSAAPGSDFEGGVWIAWRYRSSKG